MEDWYGVIALLAAVGIPLVLAWLFLIRSRRKGDSSGNRKYDKLVMRTVLPNNHGIPIDEVYGALQDIDLKKFHLDMQSNGDK